MKLKLAKVDLLIILAILLTPTVVMAIAHSDLFSCDGCHTPHNAEVLPGVPMWNGLETTVTFTTMYSSKSFQGIIDGQPSGDWWNAWDDLGKTSGDGDGGSGSNSGSMPTCAVCSVQTYVIDLVELEQR